MHEEQDIILDEEGVDAPAELKRLKNELASCRKERQDYLDGWQRAKADYANLKREEEDRRAGVRADAELALAEKLIPIMDAFAMAFAHSRWNEVDASFRTGVEGIHKEFEKLLASMEIESFTPTGEAFDPSLHIPVGEAEGPPGTVVKVERAGYRKNGNSIRPAYVIIGK